MGSVPTSPCEHHRDLFDSRSSSPGSGVGYRSSSPGVLRKRRSQSSCVSDNSPRAPVRQTKSSNIRRANSMLITSNAHTAATPLVTDLGFTRPSSKSNLQRSGSKTYSVPKPPTGQSNNLLDNLNNNKYSKNRMKAPTPVYSQRRQRDIPISIISSP